MSDSSLGCSYLGFTSFEFGASDDVPICFADAATRCNRLAFPSYRRDYGVRLPNINPGLPGGPFGNFSPLVRQALGERVYAD